MGTSIPEPDSRRGKGAGKQILVVDHNPTVGRVVAESLAALGYVAIHCPTADEALDYCRTGMIDGVLAEVGLVTDGGRSFGAVLSEDYPAVPVAVLTAWLDHPETRYIDQRGVRMVLRKPIRLDRLELAMRALLDGFRARQTASTSGLSQKGLA